jgi:hypothetical protein
MSTLRIEGVKFSDTQVFLNTWFCKRAHGGKSLTVQTDDAERIFLGHLYVSCDAIPASGTARTTAANTVGDCTVYAAEYSWPVCCSRGGSEARDATLYRRQPNTRSGVRHSAL